MATTNQPAAILTTEARRAQFDAIESTAAYRALEAATSGVIEHYHDDLYKHDRRFCADNPEWAFLHFAGDCGTHIVDLRPPCDYPARGVSVPYLFGHADREHMLSGGFSAIKAIENCGNRKLVHHWRGGELVKIDFKRAREIYLDYMDDTRAAWHAAR